MIMNKVLNIIQFLTIAILAVVCNGCGEKPQGADWGHTEYYEDHFLKEYEPVIMSDTLELEFNNDAARFFNDDDAYVELRISSDSVKFVKPKNIIVYFDNEPCTDFTFCIYPKRFFGDEGFDLDMDYYIAGGTLGIEFKDEAEEGRHQYYILYSACSGKNRLKLKGAIDEQPVSETDMTYAYDGSIANGIFVTKENVENPAAVIIKWLIYITAALLIAWFGFLRYMLFKRIKVPEINFKGPGTFNGLYKVKGYYKVILTSDNKKKQNTFVGICTGKILYLYDSVWTSDVVIEHYDKQSVTIQTSGNITCNDYQLNRYNTYEIKDRKNLNDKGYITIM